MITSFVISFRESLEVFLILVPLVIYFFKIKKTSMIRMIIYGVGLGMLSTGIAAALLFGQLNNLEGLGKRIFDGGIFVFLSMLILLNIIQFIRQKKYLTQRPEAVEETGLSAVSLFMLSYATVFRESLEIIIFNLPTLSADTSHVILGAILGLTAAFTLCALVFSLSINLNLSIIFFVLTALLIIIGADMFGEGVASLLPQGEESIETACRLVYAIPLLYIFIKKELKELMIKK
jgi:high-affinity iron transporter